MVNLTLGPDIPTVWIPGPHCLFTRTTVNLTSTNTTGDQNVNKNTFTESQDPNQDHPDPNTEIFWMSRI